MADRIGRRDFITRVIAGGVAGKMAVDAVAAGPAAAGASPPATTRPAKKKPTDRVTLGKTGIQVSRLGIGTGMKGWNHESNQTRLGQEKFTALIRHVYDRGLNYIDCADMYGSHTFLREAMKQIPREKLTIVTKTVSREADGVRKDIERFRQELGTDYLDIVLLHCLTDKDWTTKLAGCMDVLEEAREKKLLRAHGCSCHTLDALKLAAATPWVQVDLARFNPFGVKMDATPDVVASELKKLHDRGAGVLCMKIPARAREQTGPQQETHCGSPSASRSSTRSSSASRNRRKSTKTSAAGIRSWRNL